MSSVVEEVVTETCVGGCWMRALFVSERKMIEEGVKREDRRESIFCRFAFETAPLTLRVCRCTLLNMRGPQEAKGR